MTTRAGSGLTHEPSRLEAKNARPTGERLESARLRAQAHPASLFYSIVVCEIYLLSFFLARLLHV